MLSIENISNYKLGDSTGLSNSGKHLRVLFSGSFPRKMVYEKTFLFPIMERSSVHPVDHSADCRNSFTVFFPNNQILQRVSPGLQHFSVGLFTIHFIECSFWMDLDDGDCDSFGLYMPGEAADECPAGYTSFIGECS